MGKVAFRGGMLDSALALGVSFPPLGDLAEFLVTAFLEGNPSRFRPALSPTVPPASAVSSLFDPSEVPCPQPLCSLCWGSRPWAAVQSGEVLLSLVAPAGRFSPAFRFLPGRGLFPAAGRSPGCSSVKTGPPCSMGP